MYCYGEPRRWNECLILNLRRIGVVQAKKEALHNKVVKSNLKTVVKKANAAIDSNAADKETVVKVAVSAIDSAKSKGVIHKNTAARKISRMAKRANKAAAQ